MEIFTTKKELRTYLDQKKQNHKIGFIPTMGALHEGHLSLIEEAKKHTSLTVCSIFVNPTQFNDPKDLEKYPRPIEKDIALLQSVSCDILFLPTVNEIYADPDEDWHMELGELDSIWEGEHRPGHFQGVTQVVHKLFNIVQPQVACFGQKDFQQVMVIQRMLDITQQPVKIIVCPIIRNQDGLALSSRNIRLSPTGLTKALALSRSLNTIKENASKKSPQELTTLGTAPINETEGVDLEYLAICETRTLHEASEFDTDKSYVVLVVAWVDGIRLLDNILL